MSGGSAVLSDDSALSRWDRAWFRVESSLSLISGLVIFALVLLAVYNVLARKFLGAPVPGYVDWTEQFMAVFAFLGLAYCQREGGHIRMDLFVGALRGRWLWAVELISALLMWLLCTALIYGSWFHMSRSFDWNAPLWSRDSSIDIALPLWPAKLIVPFALAVLWIRLALQIWGYARALRRGDVRPVALPLPESASEQAAREAESVDG
ncbi:MAG: TRAP transporter small permease [Mangrovicoccus sp.]|nr:TRAP transporter small permease [Mangrovicoccus sp.]